MKIDFDYCSNGNRLSVQQKGSIFPLFHCIDGSLAQQRITLSQHDIFNVSFDIDRHFQDNISLNMLCPGLTRVVWVDLMDEMPSSNRMLHV